LRPQATSGLDVFGRGGGGFTPPSAPASRAASLPAARPCSGCP
jgi:hypothetical protein